MTIERCTAEIVNDGIVLGWSDGFHHRFHALWLRERSNDPSNRDPGTGLRISEAAFLPLDLSIKTVDITSSELRLKFSDGHECGYSLLQLRRAVDCPWPLDPVADRKHWDAGSSLPNRYDYHRLLADDDTLLDMMRETNCYGFSLFGNLPGDPDSIETLSLRIGPLRETNWGRTTDVRNIANPYDLTMTSAGLAPHADNPYRYPGPGYILMQCLTNSSEGGESTMVDGFQAANRLRQDKPAAWQTLISQHTAFRHEESDAILEDYGPLIETGVDGEVRRVRFSNRTEQIPPLHNQTLSDYYHARKAFAEIIYSDDMNLTFKLKPGDGLIWDNYRILHGRKPFDPKTGDRHMRHVYMDRDVFSNRFKVLNRKCSSD